MSPELSDQLASNASNEFFLQPLQTVELEKFAEKSYGLFALVETDVMFS
jgi:hypothetical protein